VAVAVSPEADVPIIVYVVAVLDSVGVPVIRPVEVLKFKPEGKVPTNEYDVTAAPAEASIVYPASVVVTTLVSVELESVNEGAELETVRVKVAVEDPDAFVPVIVYPVADLTEVGVPESKPVDVLKVRPAGAAGEIE
jgi:hypothetical protein